LPSTKKNQSPLKTKIVLLLLILSCSAFAGPPPPKYKASILYQYPSDGSGGGDFIAMNDRDELVGLVIYPDAPIHGFEQNAPVLLTGGKTYLFSNIFPVKLAPGTPYSSGGLFSGISDSGAIVGLYSQVPTISSTGIPTFHIRAFAFTPTSPKSGYLEWLPSQFSTVTINGPGVIAAIDANRLTGYVYKYGRVTEMFSAGAGNNLNSIAIDNHGVISGNFYNNATGNSDAYTYTKGKFIDRGIAALYNTNTANTAFTNTNVIANGVSLGIPPGSSGDIVVGVTADGTVVGNGLLGGVPAPWIWTPANKFQYLKDLFNVPPNITYIYDVAVVSASGDIVIGADRHISTPTSTDISYLLLLTPNCR
jgi:hypothetical protein